MARLEVIKDGKPTKSVTITNRRWKKICMVSLAVNVLFILTTIYTWLK